MNLLSKCISFLPKSWHYHFYLKRLLKDKPERNRYIQRVWDRKSDESIIEAFDDATGWIDLSLGRMETPTIVKIAEDCIIRLDKLIMPQIRRRNLDIYNH